MKPYAPNRIPDVPYLLSLISCLIKDVKDLQNIINTTNNYPSKPPLFIPWSQILENRYTNTDVDSPFVLFLNGGRFLNKGIDYNVIETGGFQIIAPELVDTPNDYILIR